MQCVLKAKILLGAEDFLKSEVSQSLLQTEKGFQVSQTKITREKKSDLPKAGIAALKTIRVVLFGNGLDRASEMCLHQFFSRSPSEIS